jgi:hypothetical protein
MNTPKGSINQKFSEVLRKNIPNHLSAVDELAVLLNINYDAAYRRLNGKVSFSLEEAVLISTKYNISLNDLFVVGVPNSYVVKDSKPILTLNDINTYLENVYDEYKYLAHREDASLLFAAREIPMFYFFLDPILIKFKFYIWFYVLNVTSIKKRTSFNDFVLTTKMIENAKKVGEIYPHINLTEIWSYGALNNVLQQLLYFYKIRQISTLDAEIIINAIHSEINNIEEYTLNNKHSTRKFQLYTNDIIMNNNAMIGTIKGEKKFFYPHTLLKFFVITDQKACEEQESYLLEQLRYCTNISNTSVKEHTSFFNHKYDKLAEVLKIIKNEQNSPLFL